MKKIITIILALAMCLSLCACGESEADIKLREEQLIFDEADALLAEGKYAEAIERFYDIESYKTVAIKVEQAAQMQREAERLAAEAAEAARPRKTVEITMDNWTEYFELKKVNVADAFGELDKVTYVFGIQESVKDKIDYEKSFEVSVKYVIDEQASYYFNYDKENDSVELLNKRLGMMGSAQEFSDSFDNQAFRLMSKAEENDTRGSLYPCVVINVSDGSYINWVELEIIDIMGEIIIFE